MVAVTVMRVLLFVLDMSMRRQCEGDGAGVVAVSAGHEYVGHGWYTWFRYCV